jgi:signal transduction histidine kinase/ActR/RegA family two-component response regulator
MANLGRAAAQLKREEVPAALTTGVVETDQVSRVLREAGLRSAASTRELERRVHEAAEAARDAQGKLLESQKHEAIGRLTGGIAHDFNNLLQTITTSLHVIDRTSSGGAQKQVLEAAKGATRKAADLVRQMLAFGRVKSLQAQPVALSDFLLKSQELTAKALGGRVQLTARIDPHLPALFVDSAQLELAILNLVFNARDAIADEGHVTIVGRLASPEETAALPPGSYAAVEVIDDGPGMSDEVRAKAFDPYFTTKPIGAGSGLGLAQVHAFARQSGGEARLESSPGAGTRVTMIVPVTTECPDEDRGGARPHAGQVAPLRILMVEDDVLVSSVVAPALEGDGHTVTTCGSADQAACLLSEDQRFDVVFTDMVMPGKMTGMDLVLWCREHAPDLPVVVATGYTTHSVDGAEVLRKPYDIEMLVAALASSVRTASAQQAQVFEGTGT